MARKPYPSDLTDAQWALIEPAMPLPRRTGRTRSFDLREVVNAVLYLVRTGCAWRQLPHEFGSWSTVHGYYRRFRRDGTWKQIHDRLREDVRVAAGRDAQPSIAVVDSQSVKTTEKGGHRERSAMTPANASRDASGTWPSTRWA